MFQLVSMYWNKYGFTRMGLNWAHHSWFKCCFKQCTTSSPFWPGSAKCQNPPSLTNPPYPATPIPTKTAPGVLTEMTQEARLAMCLPCWWRGPGIQLLGSQVSFPPPPKKKTKPLLFQLQWSRCWAEAKFSSKPPSLSHQDRGSERIIIKDDELVHLCVNVHFFDSFQSIR